MVHNNDLEDPILIILRIGSFLSHNSNEGLVMRYFFFTPTVMENRRGLFLATNIMAAIYKVFFGLYYKWLYMCLSLVTTKRKTM